MLKAELEQKVARLESELAEKKVKDQEFAEKLSEICREAVENNCSEALRYVSDISSLLKKRYNTSLLLKSRLGLDADISVEMHNDFFNGDLDVSKIEISYKGVLFKNIDISNLYID